MSGAMASGAGCLRIMAATETRGRYGAATCLGRGHSELLGDRLRPVETGHSLGQTLCRYAQRSSRQRACTCKSITIPDTSHHCWPW